MSVRFWPAVLFAGSLLLRAMWAGAAAADHPSDACYERWDRQWCDVHGVQLAEAKPTVFGDLAATNHPPSTTTTAPSATAQAGYQPGTPVANSWGQTIPVPRALLDAVDLAGSRIMEDGTTAAEAGILIRLAACESNFTDAQSRVSSASGWWQFLALSTWPWVSAETGLGDIHSVGHQAGNALWLGRHGGWQHWECWSRVR